MASVRLENLRYSFTGERPAVDDVSFTLASGELFCLLGPSGCGKSTLLRLVGGYLRPDGGRVCIGERDVTGEAPERRKTGMVFQNYALFPHLSALDNVAFGLRVRGWDGPGRYAKANETLDWLGLSAEERTRRPSQLSGGQQQRVALARALAFAPSLLMLDEPFANLDRLLRERLREELKAVQRRTETTTIFVTHDREEAFALGDRIAVMHRGRLLQIGSPEAVYEEPQGKLVADFLGHRNLFPVTALSESKAEAAGVSIVRPERPVQIGDHLLLRPEKLALRREAHNGAFPGIVRQRRFAGTFAIVTVELASGAALEVQQTDAPTPLTPGEAIWVEVPAAAVTVVRGREGA